MNYPKRYEKALDGALGKYRDKLPNGTPAVDEIYKLLEVNMQKRIRKQQIQTYLLRNAPSPEITQLSQNSSTSDDNDSDSRRKKKKNNNGSPSPNNNMEQDMRERRTIKRKRVFDPSDYAHSKKPEKPIKDVFCKLCEKLFKSDAPDATPPKKTTCIGCKKRRAHRACMGQQPMPWRCDDCVLCSICSGESPEDSPMIACLKCKGTVHQHCGNIDESVVDWTCSPCRAAKEKAARKVNGKAEEDAEKLKAKTDDTVKQKSKEEDRVKLRGKEKEEVIQKVKDEEPVKSKVKDEEPMKSKGKDDEQLRPKSQKTVRRNSSVKKQPDYSTELNNDDDDIPDCSRWTPHQVYSYLIIYVPSEDAKAFLDQEIDGRSLKLMQRNDVIANFNLKLGSALKVYAQVKRLQDRSNNIKICWP